MSKKQQKNETPAPEEVMEQEQQTEQAPQGQDQEPESLLEAALQVTPERIMAAARSVRPDTIYFLTGKEDAHA